MNVYFWGTRGSLPSPLTAGDVRAKIKQALQKARSHVLQDDFAIERFIDEELPFSTSGCFGGNTSCVEIQGAGAEYILIDAGTGIRDFGNAFMASPAKGTPAVFHIFFSHVHWDHIQGLPFFVPGYIPGNRIVMHAHHDALEQTLRMQMDAPAFPVPFEMLGADIEFDIRPPGTPFEVAGFKITTIEQRHPGVSYGYRFERDGKVIVYSNDSEHKEDASEENYPFVDFFRGADVLIFDAQYTFADAVRLKSDWGHSSNLVGVELAARAGVKNLCLCHNEPVASDELLEQIQADTRRYRDLMQMDSTSSSPDQIYVAYDSLSIEV